MSEYEVSRSYDIAQDDRSLREETTAQSPRGEEKPLEEVAFHVPRD